jgi:hypothetical protein
MPGQMTVPGNLTQPNQEPNKYSAPPQNNYRPNGPAGVGSSNIPKSNSPFTNGPGVGGYSNPNMHLYPPGGAKMMAGGPPMP